MPKRNDPPERQGSDGSCCSPRGAPGLKAGLSSRLLSGSFGAGRNRGHRLQDLRSDLVGVALRVRAAVFQVALIAAVGEGMRHADRSAAVGDTVAEGIDRRGLVLARQTHV